MYDTCDWALLFACPTIRVYMRSDAVSYACDAMRSSMGSVGRVLAALRTSGAAAGWLTVCHSGVRNLWHVPRAGTHAVLCGRHKAPAAADA